MSNSPHYLEQALDLLAERVAEKLKKPAEPTASPASDHEYVTPEQATELHGVTDRTLEEHRRRQKGPKYIKVGRLVRHLRSGLGAPITPR
jgi:hypothetical protein